MIDRTRLTGDTDYDELVAALEWLERKPPYSPNLMLAIQAARKWRDLVLDFPTDEQVEAGLAVYNRYRNDFDTFDDAPDMIRQVLEAVRRVMYGEDV